MDTDESPYLQLGFGMVTYFATLRAFILTFGILTVLAIPSLFIYAEHNGMAGSYSFSKSRYSVGNMGFSETLCK